MAIAPRAVCHAAILAALVWSGKAQAASRHPPSAADALHARDFRVRIKISELAGNESFYLRSGAGLRFEQPDGTLAFEAPSSKPIRIEAKPNTALQSFYRIRLRSFAADDRARAEKYARETGERLGLILETIDQPARPAWAIRPPSPDARIDVVAGRFATRNMAERGLRMLWRDVRGEIIRDNEHPFEGFMRIADGEGDLLGEMLCGGSVRSLELDSPTEIEAAAGAHGAPADSLRSAFRGVLSFYRASETELLPVNIAHIEDYLRGVVPAEIGAFAPTEALKAQAIASRSEAIYKLLAGSRHGDPRYDFVSTQQDQVYRGAGEEAPASDREVAATRGLVMTSGGAVIDAVYSHSCGGATASNEDLWPRGQPLPYLRSRIDRSGGGAPELGDFASVDDWLDSSPEVFCNPAQSEFPLYAKGYFRWSRVRKGDEIEAEARERGLAIGPLRYLRVKERAPSGRVVRLELQGEKAVIEIANGDTIQGLLGLPSTLFAMGVSVKDGRVEAAAFRGAGYGHGVGMCQMGAFMMARRNFNRDDILGHYFAGVRIESLY